MKFEIDGGVKNAKMQISSLFEKKFLLVFPTLRENGDFIKIPRFASFFAKKHTHVGRAVFFD